MKMRKFHLISLLAVCILSPCLQAEEIDAEHGKRIIQNLSAAIKEDTTSLRQEFKSVLNEDVYQSVLNTLTNGAQIEDGKHLDFKLRDENVPNAKNATYTFYGKSLFFKNGAVETSIKLRARFYLEMSNDGSVNLSPVIGSGAFLELKIENPAEDLEHVVNKYRIRIEPSVLNKLFSANALSPNFNQLLNWVEYKTIEYPSNSRDKDLVIAFFKAVREFTEMVPGFINPDLGIYYERSAYQLTEYPYESVDPGTKMPHSVEYQFTLDKNIKGYFVQPTFLGAFSFLEYFRMGLASTPHIQYPDSTYVFEVKVPMSVGKFPNGKRSLTHEYLNRSFIEMLKASHSKGKAGYLRGLARISEETADAA